MTNDFYKLAYVHSSYGDRLRYIIQENLNTTLIEHLSTLYQQDEESFHPYDDFAYMDTGFHNYDGNKIFAYFTPNRNVDMQKWYLYGFKTESEINDLLSSISSNKKEADEIPAKKVQKSKKLIHEPVVIFDDSPIKPKNTAKKLIDLYRQKHSGGDGRDGVVFERMLTQAIIENDFPNCINNDENLLDKICVDDYYDSGIDSICIIINGHIVTDKEFLEFIIKNDKGIRSAEIILIQSKCKDKFELKEISTFILGVQNFLERASSRKLNKKVQAWFDIKNEILEKSQSWTEISHIDVRLFYAAANATWTNSSEILGSFETLKKAVDRFENGIYKIESPVFIDENRLQKITLNENETVSAKIALNGQPLQLSGDESVMGCVAIIDAKELLSILTDETTGNLKRGLFEENVRDYQGNTNVNLSIKETIRTAPESFILRNNGITILANRLEYPNLNSVRITNPQIVNGCQTCSVIFYAYKEGLDLSKVKVFARIISTNDSETINSIVSANNNQNMVHDMINEITKEYHKKLELFFRNYDDVSDSKHVYYERRSKSLAGENICAYQKCTFRGMLQSAVAVWFDAPYEAISSEFQLLPLYKDRVFSDNHSEICYYASASLFSAFDRLIYQNRLDSKLRSARPFVCYIVKHEICAKNININDTKSAESLARSILSLCKNDAALEDAFENALSVYIKARELFKMQNKGKSMGNYLNSPKVMSYIHGALGKMGEKEEEIEAQNPTYSGKIMKIGRDRYGRWYLFINRGSDSIFAHESSSPDTSFASFQTGQNVIYEIGEDDFKNIVAKNVRK